MGGLAARLAGERYLGLNLDRGRHAAELKAALGGIKGPLMKVAQLLATIPDGLPKEYVQELAQLQANAPAMGWPFVRRRMAGELGADWQTRFRDFEKTAARAASLGQVHRATALDGTALACKLQYPDMASAVEADLRQLKLAMGLYERYDRAVTTGEIHAEIADRLREELDYEREAAHMRLYGEILRGEPGVAVPVPVARTLDPPAVDDDLARRGADPRDRESAVWPDATRSRCGCSGSGTCRFTVTASSTATRISATTRWRRTGPSICSISAASGSSRASFVRGVIDLYHALQRGDRDLAVHAYQSWGFGKLSREMIEVLNRWALFVYGPLLDDRARPIQEKRSGAYGATVAESVHRDIRRLGGVRPPREFVFMDRAAIGLGSVFMHLKAEINWYRLFHELIDDFDEAALAARQKAALAAAGVPPPLAKGA